MNMKILNQAIIILLLALCPMLLSAQNKIDRNEIILANRYYQDGAFGKAADIYYKIYKASYQHAYFKTFINCLVEQGDFERAEKTIRKEIKGKMRRPELYVQLGYILKLQDKKEEAQKSFDKAIKEIQRSKISYNSLANELLGRREYELAEKAYLDGQKRLPNEHFHYELARVYMYQRNYERMLDEYLTLLKLDERYITTVQNGIRSAYNLDVDGSLKELFRTRILKQIQAEPTFIVYNRLLIWYFTQEKQFSNALRQLIALDKRTGTEDEAILNLARAAGNNKIYDEALKAYDYLIDKNNPLGGLFATIRKNRMKLLYYQFLDADILNKKAAEELVPQFEDSFKEIGYTPESYDLLIDFAHHKAFHLNKTKEAIDLLNEGLKIKKLNLLQQSEIKTEIADVQVFMGDEWEAVLLYSQVIEANKTNELGDQAKLKKAKLSYYLGDFKWAQAQLDVIKASTSKLTSNDAFELSMMIGNNLNLDTTDVAMKMFSRADLYLFRNRDSLAVLVLDSIMERFSFPSLGDEVLFRKAEIERKKGNFEEAAKKPKNDHRRIFTRIACRRCLVPTG